MRERDGKGDILKVKLQFILCKDCKFSHMTYDGECKL